MPGRSESFRAKYDEPSTTAGNKDEVVKVHLSQVADDSIALAEKAEWPNIVAKYEKKAEDAAASVSKSCGVQASVKFRWATFDDETMANVDAWKRSHTTSRPWASAGATSSRSVWRRAAAKSSSSTPGSRS